MTTPSTLQAPGIDRAPATESEILEEIKRSAMARPSGSGIIPGRKPMKQRRLEVEEVIASIGAAGAVKINFVPQMLESLAMLYASRLADYAASRRISEFKRHIRLVRQAVKGYHEHLKEHYGHGAYGAYEMYSRQYQDFVSLDLYKMMLQLRVEAVNAIPSKDPDVAALINAITVFVTCARAVDEQMDKMLSGLLKAPVSQAANVYLEGLKALCVDLAEAYGFRLELSPTMRMWVQILTNRASELADQLLHEQNVT